MMTSSLAQRIAQLGRRFYDRGWTYGTSGNFSAVIARQPLRLAITASGRDKGALEASDILHVDEAGAALRGTGRPSAETLLHVEVVRQRGAGAVLHTHSIWSTLLSDQHAAAGGFSITGFEMLKGLDGVHTHEHREWIPILENSQDIPALAEEVKETLAQNPQCHAFLLRRHGLYTWGVDLQQATRHVEILEFLFEAVGRGQGRPSED